ncbi:MAG: DUF1499 domain-containing protein [Rubrivivax sp.]|nr:DUF1499 domain-containing protein [Rubrivivax sp.]
MTVLKWLLAGSMALVLLVVLVVLAGQMGLMRGRPPGNMGVHDGKLKPPSNTDNSVGSQAALWPGHPRRQAAHIEPLALVGDGPATMLRLRDVVAAMPGARIVTLRDDYLYAQFTSRVMKYTDDIEFWFDRAAGVVQVRSASRLGKRDFGVNRARVEAIRAQLHGR